MSDNSAEREAEEILKAAYAEVRAEECPQGEECAVHFRVDEDYVLEEAEYARKITYVDEYVVITDDNHQFDNPAFILKLVLGLVKEKPARFETLILHVGEGAIGDLTEDPQGGRASAIRYQKTHDSWEGLSDEHNITVTALREGFIDVSKPITPED